VRQGLRCFTTFKRGMQNSPNGMALSHLFIPRKHAYPDNPEIAVSNEDKSRAPLVIVGNGFARVLTFPLSASYRVTGTFSRSFCPGRRL